MHKLYNTEKNKYIIYNKYPSTTKNMPSVIFLHGLMSDMTSKKSQFLEKYCAQQGYNYITFDNFGHGKSSGNFIEKTMGSWLEGVEFILNELTENANIVMVGQVWVLGLQYLQPKNFLVKLKPLFVLLRS